MTLAESLETHLLRPPDGLERAEPHETDQIGDTPRFVIDTPEKASWALRKLAVERARLAEAVALRDAEFEKIQAWYEDATDVPARAARNFESMLRAYGERRIAEEPDLRTISVPGGKVKLTVTQQVQTVGDDDTPFIVWARSTGRPEFVRLTVTQTADKQGLRKALHKTKTGELLPRLETGHPVPVIDIVSNETWRYEPTPTEASR